MAAQTHICNIKDIFLKEVLRRCPFYGRNKIEERDLINRKKLPKAARVEYDIPSSMRLIEFERTWHVELGKYVDSIIHSISLQNKKTVYFNSHI